jgi:hypothetical protein
MSSTEKVLRELADRGFLLLTGADPRLPPVIDWAPDELDIAPDAEVSEVYLDELFREPGKPELNENGIEERIRWDDDLTKEIYDILSDDNGYKDPFSASGQLGSGQIHVLFDVYAWYCPIHFYGAEYGIYITQKGIRLIAKQLAYRIPANKRRIVRRNLTHAVDLLKRAAFYFWYFHEFYHHKIESFATRLEMIENQPRFVSYSKAVYEKYSKPHPSDDLIEEQLAVAEVLRTIDEEYNFKKFWGYLGGGTAVPLLPILREFVFSQISKARLPLGYRRARELLNSKGRIDPSLFEATEHKLFSTIQDSVYPPLSSTSRWTCASGLSAPLFQNRLPVYEIINPGSVRLLFGQIRPAVQASPSKALRQARKWGVDRSSRQGKGDHLWLINECLQEDFIDSGASDMSRKDWDALLNLISKCHGIELPNNIEGRKIFFEGPKKHQ